MKISKIIFISILTILALYILAEVIYIRIYGFPKGDLSNFTIKKHELSTIRALEINNCKNIEIFICDSTMIKSFWKKDSIIPKEIFTVKNDTLVLSDIKGSVLTRIYANKYLRNILLKDSEISIESATSNQMDIDMDKSELFISLADSCKHSLKSLKINAMHKSNIRSRKIKVDSLEVILQNSDAYLGLYANNLNGSITDSSKLTIQEPHMIGMKRDTTSNIYIYNWY
jgi:hypothetical protein